MATELWVLGWGCVLALVHVFAAVRMKTRQYGTTWNMGARDEAVAPLQPVAGRLARAQANYFETFPVMIAAVAIAVLAGRTSEMTAAGAWIWLGARIVDLPLYAAGVPVVRTVCFLVSVVGILMVQVPAMWV